MRLHHVGILVKDIDASSKDYVTKYGAQVVSDLIHDKVQTASVQFLKVGNEALIELITPDNSSSKLSSALKKGGGLHHLCYSVSDIEVAIKDLTDQGMMLLHPPVSAVAFDDRKISWLMGLDNVLVELVEEALA